MALLQAMGFFVMITFSLQRELEQQAHTDPLTGALNRRALMEQMKAALSAAKRKSQAISVIAMDLDHFKRINDRFGHHVGDMVLKQFSAVVQAQKRTEDFFARMGGEEFLLVLPDTSQQSAFEVARRIHKQLNAPESVPEMEALPLFTASFGISAQGCDQSSDAVSASINTLFEQADTALYTAKNTGRNRVEIFSSTISDQ